MVYWELVSALARLPLSDLGVMLARCWTAALGG